MTYVIIGLGNPGGEYAKTRHNAGRMAAELFAKHSGLEDFSLKKSAHALVASGMIADKKVVVALPETFMNASGKTASALVKSVPAAKHLLVIRDDLDLPVGTIKMTTYGRGSGGQKGVESIAQALKTKEFAQLKIGISKKSADGSPKKESGDEAVTKHVLGTFAPAEDVLLQESLAKAVKAIEIFVRDGLDAAMLFANTRN